MAKLIFGGRIKKGADKGKTYSSRLFPRKGNGKTISVFSIKIGNKGKKFKNIITKTVYTSTALTSKSGKRSIKAYR